MDVTFPPSARFFPTSNRQICLVQLVIHLIASAGVAITRCVLSNVVAGEYSTPIAVTVVEVALWAIGIIIFMRLREKKPNLTAEPLFYWPAVVIFYVAAFVLSVVKSASILSILGGVMM